MKPLKWITNKEQTEYMAKMKALNISKCVTNENENLVWSKLSKGWTRQAVRGYRIHDFWNHELGCAIEVEGVTRGLAYVGKTKIVERRSVELPDGLYNYSKEPVVEYLKEHHQEEGWIQDLYLGSQGSITLDQKTKKYTANYAVYRYVAEPM